MISILRKFLRSWVLCSAEAVRELVPSTKKDLMYILIIYEEQK